MASRYEMVTVQVSNKMLYVGERTAIPLAGVVRVQWELLKINQLRYIKALIANIVLFVVVFFAAQGIGDVVGGVSGGTGPPSAFGLIQFAAFVYFGLRSVEPVQMLALASHPYYVLSIDTAGSVGSRLINPDGESMGRIAGQIISAIDNPEAEWRMQVNNYHVGDTVNQTGAASIGKVTG